MKRLSRDITLSIFPPKFSIGDMAYLIRDDIPVFLLNAKKNDWIFEAWPVKDVRVDEDNRFYYLVRRRLRADRNLLTIHDILSYINDSFVLSVIQKLNSFPAGIVGNPDSTVFYKYNADAKEPDLGTIIVKNRKEYYRFDLPTRNVVQCKDEREAIDYYNNN